MHFFKVFRNKNAKKLVKAFLRIELSGYVRNNFRQQKSGITRPPPPPIQRKHPLICFIEPKASDLNTTEGLDENLTPWTTDFHRKGRTYRWKDEWEMKEENVVRSGNGSSPDPGL